MARVTVEDCVQHIENRYDLVILASHRAREIIAGSQKLIDSHNSEPVVSLREIAANLLDLNELKKGVIRKFKNKNKSYMSEMFSSNPFNDVKFDIPQDEKTMQTPSNDLMDSSIFADQNIEIDD
jgi:DNA-directed RNA polymerase omega subunit